MADGCVDEYEYEYEEEQEEQFFDSRDDAWSAASESCPEGDLGSWVTEDPWRRVWIQKPESVRERRDKFLRSIGWDLTGPASGERSDDTDVVSMLDTDRIMLDGSAVLRMSDSEDVSSEEGMFVMDEFGDDGSLRSPRELGIERVVAADDSDRSFVLSSFVQKLMRRDDNSASSNSDKSVRRRMGWLKRLGVVACVVDREGEEKDSRVADSGLNRSMKNHRVKVRPYRKKSKEFSAVFTGQDFRAHDGAILTMKFSPDGQYVASGGEDGIVRVWRVAVHERTDEDDLPEDEPSCIYFKANHNSELTPLYADKEKKVKSGIRSGSSDPACVVIPSEVFRINEEPVHEFRGHQGDVLDLSWSKDKLLLSASTDKTARLWRVGCDSCIGVFSHSNYVTCLQFNPVNENYFISGSIDGKVRLWEIPRFRVVDWIDIREIVTAVCYRPDGKAGVAGTLSGVCHFYDASDNQLQLDALVSLQGKKKSPDKRITGFEFSPDDQRKLMVTSADSQVRILDGGDVVCKYKGIHNSGSQISASFTSDGKYIISASEDSNVYVWNYNNQEASISNHVKSTWSYERFSSSDASVAIPWNGFVSKNQVSLSSEFLPSQQEVTMDLTGIVDGDFHCRADSLGNNTIYLSPSDSFTLNQDLFSEFLPKGSATWPEEKLPSSSAALCRSNYKFLKTSLQNASSAWGQVIVTAGWDGRIRSFRNYGLPVQQ